MALKDVVIASLTTAEESIGYARKGVEYLNTRYGLNHPDVASTIYPKIFTSDEYSPENLMGEDLKGKHVVLCAVPTNPDSKNFYVTPLEMAGRAVVAADNAKYFGAKKVTLIAPDLHFGRADQGYFDLPKDAPKEKLDLFKGKSNVAKAQAKMFRETIDQIIAIHLHSQRVRQSYNEVYGRDDALIEVDSAPLLVHYMIKHSMADMSDRGSKLVMIDSDFGIREYNDRILLYLNQLGYDQVSRVSFKKIRVQPNNPKFVHLEDPVFSENYTGLEGKTTWDPDDIDDTGGTKAATCNTLMTKGLRQKSGRHEKPANFISSATHPVLTGSGFRNAMQNIIESNLLEIVYFNTHPFIENNMIYPVRKCGSVIRTAWYTFEHVRCNEEGIPFEEICFTNDKLDLDKIEKVVPPPFRRTEHPKYGQNHH